MTALLEARDIHFSYGDHTVLEGVSLSVGSGEVVALLGGNGAGKSTFLQLALGLLKPRSGSLSLHGFDPVSHPLEVRRRLAYVPETVAAYPELTGLENLEYFLVLAGVETTPTRLAGAFEEAGLTRDAWTRPVSTYSKGMRQKLAIALALAREATLLLLDEPASGLDPAAMAELDDLLIRLRQRGVSSLLVTHDLLAASAVGDRLVFLARGRIAAALDASGAERFDLQHLRELYFAGDPKEPRVRPSESSAS